MNEREFQSKVVEDVGKFHADPLAFVLYAFPWGSGELSDHVGPDDWQRDTLTKIRDGLLTADEALRLAIASGHGIGKSALVAWLILWAMSTHEDTRGVVTANTDTQLRTKTWPELAKWNRLAITSFMFEVTATAIFSRQEGHEKNWRIDLVPWSERNVEAFAGLHNKGKRILLIFDEASAIPDIIWETAEGAMTDEGTQIIWFVAGNPTRNTGRFRECFGRYRHRWTTMQIDSRTARMANKKQLQQWVDDYGEDSDFVRVRVRGVFPRAGNAQFIPSDITEAAQKRETFDDLGAPVVIGVDVARFGSDESVIRVRVGRDARTIKPRKFRGVDTMQLAAYVVEDITKYSPDAVFIDGNGVGGGVVDRLRSLGYRVTEVQFGAKAANVLDYVNKRAECWGRMKSWLSDEGAIDPHDLDLATDLTAVEYGYDSNNRLQLEKKEDMAKRGLASPDNGDALALTFAEQVSRRDTRHAIARRATFAKTEYNPFAGVRP
jgi:hypothetical protein